MSQKTMNSIRFAFFGTSHIATMVLDELEKAQLMPALIVTMSPRAKGRGMQETPTAVDTWARAHSTPLSYTWDEFKSASWDVAVVVDYGKILPDDLIAVPQKGFLNIHPSLLPRLRGASPMRSAILNDEKETGVTIFVLDNKMDHGPIVAQKKVVVDNWPIKNSELERILLPLGGALLAQILPSYVAGDIDPQEQNHDLATYAGKFTKDDGRLDLDADAYKNMLKIRAFEGWPGTYALFERAGKEIRVQILDAHMEGSRLIIDRVKPEGKGEMAYDEFVRSGAKPL